ncbi:MULTISPECIES: ABC transporter ATP-binding protein [unclassified Pseudomonas]|uniref:ABC transporter ATP-binding protein n=1 Tax=unclassified Pseudomonas TaxID=196821 RepID=UPI000C87F9B0|nr:MULTISPECIES: ABC transporter ATP-binding protein [unclassified Pseudomonas]PMZ94543.1 sulfonate ABC transporter ATP-binding protein [Pseudomonas sp. FW305-42]PNA21554.1 sulfonate ABC transporter ATP-binding protein [Pseudomonas sp. MPR-R1B]PNB24397.1 sulfonate ABC transporter ATP-binding protein [Pseudomonas sp. DP16D-E2]PNB41845.1 sulfonate ABC transporter ATP-binding protein [Pseudomonas sp. FW305-17]PNB57929.1 sulfonate ABC transporter ATP-binding protein [Pseudomonas sp. GW531-E2]
MNAIAHALPTSVSPAALTIRGLSKAYPLKGKPVPVLEDIDLDIRPGEFVSILGASGCGKSTLLRLIVGLDQDYQGQILLDQQAVRGPGLERGIVFQDHRLFPWMTLQQNIALALKNHRLPAAEKSRLVAEHIELVGLGGYEQAYPHQLSGGMAQRAAIARALVNKPKVLLLDEPLGALDALTRVRLQQELQRIWVQERCTVIMVTHDVEEALYLGDRVIVMDARPGRIKEDISIPLPHPRRRDSARLHDLKQRLLQELAGA